MPEQVAHSVAETSVCVLIGSIDVHAAPDATMRRDIETGLERGHIVPLPYPPFALSPAKAKLHQGLLARR